MLLRAIRSLIRRLAAYRTQPQPTLANADRGRLAVLLGPMIFLAGCAGGPPARPPSPRVDGHFAGAQPPAEPTAGALPPLGPIPQWSANYAFRQEERAAFLRSLGVSNPSLFAVGDRLASVLSDVGYSDRGFYGTPGGFAVVARLEKIENDGRPSSPARFISPQDDKPFGFGGFLASLLFGEEGFYRVILVVATDQVVSPQAGPPTVQKTEAWFARAANSLPASFRTTPFTKDHNLTVLIYEFRKNAGEDETSVVPVTRLSSADHLIGAGLYSRLGLGS